MRLHGLACDRATRGPITGWAHAPQAPPPLNPPLLGTVIPRVNNREGGLYILLVIHTDLEGCWYRP